MRIGAAPRRPADCCSAMTDRRNSRHESEEHHKGQEKREAFAAASLACSMDQHENATVRERHEHGHDLPRPKVNGPGSPGSGIWPAPVVRHRTNADYRRQDTGKGESAVQYSWVMPTELEVCPMLSRPSPRIATIVGLGALLMGAAATMQSASATDRRGYVDRSIDAEHRANADAAWQRRELDAARQSLSAEARARETEERARAVQRRIEEIGRSARPTSR